MRENKSVNRANSVPILEILAHYNIAVSNNKMKCLWHDDSHPSAHIYTETNMGYCFACSQGTFGNINIVMLKENMEFMDAVNFINNNFAVNSILIGKKKKSIEQYFKLNDELRSMIKSGTDPVLVGKYGNMMDLYSNDRKMMLKLYGGLLNKINGVKNVSERNENR